MRELTLKEMEAVHGGSFIADSAGEGGVIGTLGGAVLTNSLQGAARGGLVGAALGGSFGFGYVVGGYLYDQLS